MADDSIAIIGLGAYYPGARGPRQLWENVLTRRREFRRIPPQRLSAEYLKSSPGDPDTTYATRAAVIDGFIFDWAARRVPRTTFDSTDIVHWLALEVALEALSDAGHSRETIPADRTGVIVGNTLTGEIMRSHALRLRWPFFRRALSTALEAHGMSNAEIEAIASTTETTFKSVLAAPTEDSLAGGLSNTIAGRICTALGAHGGGYTVDGACASSLLAVATAANALQRGDLDLALAGGVDVSIDPFELVTFSRTGAIATGDMHVYDKRANGFIAGEGCGFVVLQRLADARAAGRRIYAVLRGWGVSSDGRGGITAPDRDGQALAIERAYEKAGYGPDTLHFVEGHGTGTVVGDRIELQALAKVLGSAGSKPRSVGITSFKSIVGHTKAAAGVGGLIKATIAVNRRVIPPTAACRDPNATFDGEARSLYPVMEGSVQPATSRLRAGVSAMGFGGINCHVTLESADPPAANLAPAIDESTLLASAQETELFVLAARDLAEFAARARELADAARDASMGDLVDLSDSLARRCAADKDMPGFRGALVAASPGEVVELALEAVTLAEEASRAPHGVVWSRTRRVWVGVGNPSRRVGFLFPGQGSQMPGMAGVPLRRHEAGATLAAAADTWLGRTDDDSLVALVLPALDRMASDEQRAECARRLAATENAQPAICLASLAWLRRLGELGIAPDAVGGHSLGELTAFHAAGAFDERSLLRLAALRGQAMTAQHATAGAMMSVRCDLERAESLLSETPGYVVIANINSPSQVVVSGERSAIVALRERARAAGIAATMLPVSNAFHSRMIEGACEALRQADLPDSFEPSEIAVFSGLTGKGMAGPIPLREHFASQVISRVDFVSLVRDLAQNVDLMFEVGPGGVLSSLVQEILGDAGPQCFALESRPGRDADFNTALAAAHAFGISVRWERLCEGRLVRPFLPAREKVFITNPCELPFEVPIVARSMQPHGRLEASLAAASGASAERLTRYLEKRTPFLAAIVRSDLDSLGALLDTPLSAPLPAEPLPSQASVIQDAHEQGVEALSIAGIAAILLEIIVDRTRYPRATVAPHMRLLEDLALDSIKAAEVVAETASRIGLAGRIDSVAFATSSIEQIAEALYLARDARAVPEADDDSWVRDFVTECWSETIPDADPEASLRNARVLLVTDGAEGRLVTPLREALMAAGAALVFGPDTAEPCEPSHIIVLMPSVASADTDPVSQLRRIISRLGLAALRDPRSITEPRSLAFVQFGGGRFGAHGEPADPEMCCSVAFAASLHLERPNWKVRVLDFAPQTGGGFVAEAIVAELETAQPWSAAGYDANLVRRVPRQRPLDVRASAVREASWTSEDVLLATGGARGITAECALALARQTGARAVLVGRSPHPSSSSPSDPVGQEIAGTLKRFEDEGLVAIYETCDVTDGPAVNELIARIEREVGRVSMILHGSAQNRPGRIERVAPEDVFDELAPKVLGAHHLLDALQGRPLKALFALTSIIGVTGMPGNAWYGLSNELIATLLEKYAKEHPETATLSIAFGVWKEVGMGARMGSVATLAKMGIGALPRAEAVKHFLDLVNHRVRPRQVIVGGRMGLDTWHPMATGKVHAAHFLETLVAVEPGVEVVARRHLHPSRDPYLNDHNFRGTLLFPTVFGLEAMAQAAALAAGRAFALTAIEDIELPRPIPVDPDRGTTIETRALVLPRDPGAPVRVKVEIRMESTGFARAHFSAVFAGSAGIETAPHAPPILPKDREPMPLELVPDADLYGSILFQGPRYQRLGAFYGLQSDSCQFDLLAGSGEWDGGGAYIDPEVGPLLLGDPYARDALLQSAQVVMAGNICLPVAIERIEFRAAEGPRAQCFGEFQVEGAETSRSDEHVGMVIAFDADGRWVERLRGYRVRALDRRAS